MGRLRGWWGNVGGDVATFNGTNAGLNDPLESAFRLLGLPQSDPAAVTDTDCAAVPSERIDAVLDVAEWRAILTVWENWTDVTQKVSLGSQQLSDFAKWVEAKATMMTAKVLKQYGIGARIAPAISQNAKFAFPTPGLVSPPLPPVPLTPWGLGDGRVDH